MPSVSQYFKKRVSQDQSLRAWQDAQNDLDNGRLVPRSPNWQKPRPLPALTGDRHFEQVGFKALIA